MEVIFQNHIAVDSETAIVLQKTPGVIEDLYGFGLREHREPADDGAGEEVGVVVFAEAVAGTGHSVLRDAERPDVRSPRGAWERVYGGGHSRDYLKPLRLIHYA